MEFGLTREKLSTWRKKAQPSLAGLAGESAGYGAMGLTHPTASVRPALISRPYHSPLQQRGGMALFRK